MMTQSETLSELAKALSAAQAEFVAIPKDSTNPFFKSRYAGLPKVVEVASPILTKHGLAVSQFIGSDDHGDTLTTWLLHSSGEFIAESMRLHLAKQDAQGQGSATTYARRYSYMSVLGLVADEDDDGNQASRQGHGRIESFATRKPASTSVKLVTPEDLDALRAAATGLTNAKIKMVFTACGLGTSEPFDVAKALRAVPQSKAVELTRKLAETKR